MNTTAPLSVPILMIWATSLLLMLAGCDNPASGDSHRHTHADAAGLEVVSDGKVIFKYHSGEVTQPNPHRLKIGSEYLLKIFLLNDHGEHIHTEDLDAAYSLDWHIEDEQVLSIRQHENNDPWSFHVTGKTEGKSRVQFMINHGTHSDLSTPEIQQKDAITLRFAPQ